MGGENNIIKKSEKRIETNTLMPGDEEKNERDMRTGGDGARRVPGNSVFVYQF